MAIRIDCYELITPVQIGKQYFPKQYAEEWCWNDGVICTPMRAMNPWGMDSIMETCEELSLKRFREENGERVIGDFYVATQFGFDDTLGKKGNWLRAYREVAWNPSCPLGIKPPDSFPCYHGGFYYESEKVWREAGLALNAFNEVLDECESRQPYDKKENDFVSKIIGRLPQATPYDNFFIELSQKTFKQPFFEYKRQRDI